ncbi:glycogen synthase GlgA [uncultured Roseobacter sp.]|uniref:glycogen synthase GlgA n=1 Tax=uncultured Roseobacter sp. TaxID=114847 RepID=UPI002620EDF4|nr:glycogen synthase GlgA [uncultured Roseobacter sp.]
MKVLSVASECAPFVKTGGLADVVGALPKALAPLGVSMRVLLPGYPALGPLLKEGKTLWEAEHLPGGPARLVSVESGGIDLLLLDAPDLYDRPGNIYLNGDGQDWSDNAQRFAALSMVAAKVATGALADWQPDLVHLHDWQAGLTAAYLHQSENPPPCITTIHNIAFQGLFDPILMTDLSLSSALYTSEGIEYFGRISFLKAGLVYADRITTVSPTYAAELMQPEFGMGLEGLLSARSADLSGILNGIDLDVWDPENDPALAAPYSVKRLKPKAENKAAVLRRFGLQPGGDGPLFCVISRLTTQKGLDLLLDALPALVSRGARLAVLGSGDAGLEAGFVSAAHRYPGSVGVIIGYDEPLSHLMQGGSDAIVIPSRFEPCGLTQLYGLRYGTLPVVARTGGLADTVIDANEAARVAGCATGVQFAPVTADALEQALMRTCDLYAQPREWAGMMRRAMRHPVGWDTSAAAYHQIYADVLSTRAAQE